MLRTIYIWVGLKPTNATTCKAQIARYKMQFGQFEIFVHGYTDYRLLAS